jgi:hypothetical protein
MCLDNHRHHSIPTSVSRPESRPSLLSAAFKALAGMLSTCFVIACWSIYWLTAGAGALLIPKP